MKHISLRGKLTTWNDERGFGFITSDDGNSSVFIHISALKGMSRRPIVGDIIAYEIEDNHGKVRAIHASIEGVPSGNQRNTRYNYARTSSSGIDVALGIILIILILLIGVGLFIVVESRNPSTSPPILTVLTKPGCVIKGNISISTGHKIYHLPGLEDYDSTMISPSDGERWFCTESEAIAQGWRKAPR